MRPPLYVKKIRNRRTCVTSFILLIALLFASPHELFPQQQVYDLVTYTPPAGWKKQSTDNALQLSKENTATGGFCMVTVLKSMPGTADPKANFDAAWETVVKGTVKTTGAPEMQPAAKENGWEVLSGYAQFESEGQKGIAMLVTSTGFQKMMNILVLTNSNEFEQELTAFLESVNLAKPSDSKPAVNNTAPPAPAGTTTPVADGFAFTTTNFDDGWTSTVQADWVEVTKGNLKVLLHYPKQGTIFPADPDPLTKAAWNILVAPRYSNLKNFRTTYITTYNRPYLASGYATDNKTGKEVYLAFYRQGETGWIEFIAPDKNSFVQYFKVDIEAVQWDSESALMDPLARMTTYNKFAVSAADLKGTWTSDFTGVQQLYHAYSGQYAGMNVNQSSQSFIFGTGNSYQWKILSVNGMVGSAKYSQAKSAGKFTVPNNWQVQFSDIEGKPKKYNAQFSCIKGARILWLQDAVYTGSGYTGFGKKQ